MFASPLSSVKLPWSVSIQQNGKQKCSGTIINQRVIITSGQCVEGVNPSSLNVKLGTWGSANDTLSYEEDRKVSQIIVHPSNKNLALVVLQTASSHNVFVGPMCIPLDDENFEGSSCVLLGNEPKSATIKNVENMEVTPCSNYPKLAALVPPNSICTEKNEDMTLNNHQGAGLVCKYEDNEKTYQLAGIMIDGNDRTPSVFVNVASYREWIDQTMEKLGFDSSSYINDPTSSRIAPIYLIAILLGAGAVVG